MRARALRGNASSPGPSPKQSPPRAPLSGGWTVDGVPAEAGWGSSASSLPFPQMDFRRSGLDREDANTGVTCGHHVLMSLGACLAPCGRAWHWLSCATDAGAAGSGSSAPSPVTQDGPSGSPSPAGSCLGRHRLHPCASATSFPILLKGETGRSLACILYAKKKPFQSFYLHFAAGFQRLLLQMPLCPLFFVSVLPQGPAGPPRGGGGGETQQGSGCLAPGWAPPRCPGHRFWVVSSWLSTVPSVWGETSWSPCSLLSPSRG